MGRQCLAEIRETRVEGVDQLPYPPSYPMGLPPRWAVGSSMQGAGEAVVGRGMTVNVVVDTGVQTGIDAGDIQRANRGSGAGLLERLFRGDIVVS